LIAKPAPLLKAFFYIGIMKLLLLSICMLSCLYTFPQQKKMDSLLAVNAVHQKPDSQKVVLLVNIFRQYSFEKNFIKVEEYGAKAREIAKRLPQTNLLFWVNFRLARCYHASDKFIQAIDYYSKALEIASQRSDKKRMAGIYVDMGALYGSIPDYTKALEANERAVALFNDLGDKKDVNSNYMNMGLLYLDMKNPVKAVEYIKKALSIFKSLNPEEGSSYGMSLAYDGLGNAIQIAADEDLIQIGVTPAERDGQSLKDYTEALRVAKAGPGNENNMEGEIYEDIGKLYEKEGNHVPAMQNYIAALNFIKSRDGKQELSGILYTLGSFYNNLKDYQKSKWYLYQGLLIARQSGFLSIQQDVLRKLSSLYENTGRVDSAYIFYKQYIAIKDSVFNKDKEKEITRKQLQIDFAIKENDYKLQRQVSDEKLKVQQAQISFDKKITLFLVIAILLSIVIAALIFNNQRKTKRLNTIISEQKIVLEQLGNVKDKIFSVVTHDMRAPVNSLVSFIDILEDGKISPEKLSLYAKELKQNLTYTSALMNNLLNWAASQMQGFKPVNEKFDVSLLVTEVADTLQHHLQQKQVTVKNNIPADAMIQADSNMTAAILRNLISNAIKYSYPQGTITVSKENTGKGYAILVKEARPMKRVPGSV
jgi:signal transduction histidine kinase